MNQDIISAAKVSKAKAVSIVNNLSREMLFMERQITSLLNKGEVIAAGVVIQGLKTNRMILEEVMCNDGRLDKRQVYGYHGIGVH